MKLYELSEQIRLATQMIADGEISEDDMSDTLEGLNLEFDDKVDSTAMVIREMQLEAEANKAEATRFTEKKQAIEKRVDRLKDYLRSQMEFHGKTKVKGKNFSVTLGKPSDAMVMSGDYDKKYEVTVISPDKAQMKKDLKAGDDVKGASLVQGKAKLIIK